MAHGRLIFRASFVVLVVLILSSASVAEVRGWGLRAHKFVAERAMGLLPEEPFFNAFGDLVVEYSIYPDIKWRGEDPSERYRHFYDVDLSPDGVNPELGMLPWALADNYLMFVESLRARDWERAALLAGAITHYATDITMPLHATSDYNPGGRHVAFEDGVDGMLHEITIYDYEPRLLENVFQATVEVALDSFGYAGYESDKVSYWLVQGVLWNDVLRGITENRLNVAVRLTADIWYTALIDAGLVKAGVSTEEGPRTAWAAVAIAAMAFALVVITYVLRKRAQPATSPKINKATRRPPVMAEDSMKQAAEGWT